MLNAARPSLALEVHVSGRTPRQSAETTRSKAVQPTGYLLTAPLLSTENVAIGRVAMLHREAKPHKTE